jgi:hypothetical protein
MASYRQLESTYPYFCQSGPAAGSGTSQDFSMNTIATSPTFWNNGTNLERGSECITTNTANGLLFTAPVNGLYYFKIILNCINQSGAGDDSGDWGFTITKSGTATNRYITDNPEYFSATDTEYNTKFSTIAYLAKDDTVKMYSARFVNAQTYIANSCFFIGYLVAGLNE